MTRNYKLLLGLLSFLPLLSFALFLAWRFSTTAAAFSFDTIPVPVIALAAVMVMALGLLAYYVMHAMRNPALNFGDKYLWVISLFVISMLAMPLYWYRYILREPGHFHSQNAA